MKRNVLRASKIVTLINIIYVHQNLAVVIIRHQTFPRRPSTIAETFQEAETAGTVAFVEGTEGMTISEVGADGMAIWTHRMVTGTAAIGLTEVVHHLVEGSGNKSLLNCLFIGGSLFNFQLLNYGCQSTLYTVPNKNSF